MKALSLTQPWCWIILHLGKRIENRSRNLGNYRGTLLLHASKGMTRADYESAFGFVLDRFGRETADRIPWPPWVDLTCPLRFGAIVGVCEVVNQCRPPLAPGLGPTWPPCHVNAGDTKPTNWADQEHWYMGAHAYVLDQVRELTAPIPCKGALGLWTPPAEVAALVHCWMSGGERP